PTSTQAVVVSVPLGTPTPHLVEVKHGTSHTPTATAVALNPVPPPNQANAILGSPLMATQPLSAGAVILLSKPLPTGLPATASVANVSPPLVPVGVALSLAARLGAEFWQAAAPTITNTASSTGPFAGVGPWHG